MKQLLSIALLCLVPCAHAEEPFEFKGWKLGSPYAEYETRGGFDCKLEPRPHCHNRAETIAGVWPKQLLLHFTEDLALASIMVTIPSDEFDKVAEALTQKWGKPYKVEEKPVKNRMGASFTDTRITWINKSGTILAKRYTDTIDEAMIMFLSKQAVKESADRSKSEAAKRAKDL